MLDRPERRRSRAAGRDRFRRRRSRGASRRAEGAGAVGRSDRHGSHHRPPAPRPDPALFAGSGKVAEIAARRIESGADIVIFDHSLSGAQQRNLERALDCRVRRSSEPDSGYFRAAGTKRGRQASGRARATRASFDPPGARVDPPRAANRRHRTARAWRDAARERPPPDRSTRQAAQGSAAACRPPARDAAARATARRGSQRRAGGLHQRRQIDAVQPHDRRRELRRGPAFRDPRHHAAPAGVAGRGNHRRLRHGRIHQAICRTIWSPPFEVR